MIVVPKDCCALNVIVFNNTFMVDTQWETFPDVCCVQQTGMETFGREQREALLNARKVYL